MSIRQKKTKLLVLGHSDIPISLHWMLVSVAPGFSHECSTALMEGWVM